MKKITSVLIVFIAVLLVGCGTNTVNTDNSNNTATSTPSENIATDTKPVKAKKEYNPSQAQFGQIYKTEKYKNTDGSYPVINVKNILIKDNNIVVQVDAPDLELMKYALNKFISFEVFDKYGTSIDVGDIKLQDGNADGVGSEFIISSKETDKAEWIEVGPYKNNNDFVIYKITK